MTSLLLIAAFLCAYIIPLVRNITMGLIFYLGFIAIIYALLEGNRQKHKILGGYILSNLIFLVMTVAFYAVFSGLMAVTTSDAVLTVQSVQVNTGNPVWTFILIIIASGFYIFGMFKMIDFCFKNYRDMGFEVYMATASIIGESISSGMDKLTDKVSNYGSEESSGTVRSVRRRRGHVGEGAKTTGGVSGGERVHDTGDNEGSSSSSDSSNRDYDTRTYRYGDDKYRDTDDIEEIDREIEKGKKM